jgi:hypothetical protein
MEQSGMQAWAVPQQNWTQAKPGGQPPEEVHGPALRVQSGMKQSQFPSVVVAQTQSWLGAGEAGLVPQTFKGFSPQGLV